MAARNDKRTIAVVSACMRADGTPDFALNEVQVTQEEAENGVHYTLAEMHLLTHGYLEPFVHFDQAEAPRFLIPAVRRHVTRSAAQPAILTFPEKRQCPASSK